MAKHALIRLGPPVEDTGRRYDIDGQPQDLSHKNPPMKLVPVVVDAKPAHDPATHKVRRGADQVSADELRETWEVVPLSADELESRDRADKLARVGQQVATLRQWADDAQGVTVNNLNNNAVTQQLLDRLGIFFDRFADLLEGQYLDK